MKDIDLPQGYAETPWSVEKKAGTFQFSDAHGHLFANVDGSHDETANLFALAPAMAEEIRRLREEVEKVTDDRDRLNLALAQAGEWINAALAKPQGAQEPDKAELPAGCEPFDIERATVEGARDKDGNLWNWDGGNRGNDGWKFKSKHDYWWFNEQGIATSGSGRVFKVIFCIAKPSNTEGGV